MKWTRLVAPAALALFFTTPAAALDITVSVGTDYPPYVDANLEGGGWNVVVVKRAFEEAGHTVVDVKQEPWKRGYSLMEQGKNDGTFPWSKTPEREETVLFSEPLFDNSTLAWSLAATPLTIGQLDGKTFCLPNGYAAAGKTEELVNANPDNLKRAKDMVTCFRQLKAGRVDFVVSAENEALASIASAGLTASDFAPVAEPLADSVLRYLVGKANPNAEMIISALNEGLAKLRASGEFDEIVARY